MAVHSEERKEHPLPRAAVQAEVRQGSQQVAVAADANKADAEKNAQTTGSQPK